MEKFNSAVFRGSLILVIVFGLYSFINFLYQSSMARLLSLADYGVLAALFYFVYLFNIFSEAMQTTSAKYASGETKPGKLNNIIRRMARRARLMTLVLLIAYLAIVVPLGYFVLKIPIYLVLLFGLMCFSVFFLPLLRGVAQGQKRFYVLGGNLVLESVIKIVIAISLVVLGWGIYGAVAGLVISTLVAIPLAVFPFMRILKSKQERVELGEAKVYTKSVFIATFALLFFYSVDIFIAQLFFTKEIAGQYAIASILSKIIFWGTQPVSKAMLPLSAETKSADRKQRKNIYRNALGLVALGIVVVLALFYFFPDLIVSLFSGKNLPEAIRILFILGIGTSFLSLANLNIIYSASRGNIEKTWLLIGALIVGVALLMIFHSSLLVFSIAFLTASTIFLWASIMLLKE